MRPIILILNWIKFYLIGLVNVVEDVDEDKKCG